MAKKKQKSIQEEHDEMVDGIISELEELKSDLEKSKRFKAAARRARKRTTELGNHMFLSYRKLSNQYDKER